VRYWIGLSAPRQPFARRSGRRLKLATGACVAAAAMLASGCGDAPNPPIAIVQSYLNALGGGEYDTACGMVDGQALVALTRAKHVRVDCPQLLKRCLPNRSLVLKRDQTQLLYANIEVSLSDNGRIADADTSATPVATELKHVTLRHERGAWKFTGLGQAIEACHLAAHKHKHKHMHKPRQHSARKS
jgi:hypothetical protein